MLGWPFENCVIPEEVLGGIWTWGQVIIWEVFYEGSLSPATSLNPTPFPRHFLSVLCWQLGALGWLLRSGAIFPLLSG